MAGPTVGTPEATDIPNGALNPYQSCGVTVNAEDMSVTSATHILSFDECNVGSGRVDKPVWLT